MGQRGNIDGYADRLQPLSRAGIPPQVLRNGQHLYPTPRSWTASDQVLKPDLPEVLGECTGGMVGPQYRRGLPPDYEIFASLPDVNPVIADPDHGVCLRATR